MDPAEKSGSAITKIANVLFGHHPKHDSVHCQSIFATIQFLMLQLLAPVRELDHLPQATSIAATRCYQWSAALPRSNYYRVLLSMLNPPVYLRLQRSLDSFHRAHDIQPIAHHA